MDRRGFLAAALAAALAPRAAHADSIGDGPPPASTCFAPDLSLSGWARELIPTHPDNRYEQGLFWGFLIASYDPNAGPDYWQWDIVFSPEVQAVLPLNDPFTGYEEWVELTNDRRPHPAPQ